MNKRLNKSVSIKNATRHFWLLAVLYVFLSASAGLCDVKHYRKVTMAQAYEDFSWTREAWTGDDKPFQQARNEIDAQLATGKDANLLMLNLKAKALQKPNDALAQFRWGYAAYSYASNQTVKEEVRYAILPEILVALASVPSPHSYNFSRLRFLIQASGIVVPFQLKSLGERLLNKNPQDTLVKYDLASLLDTSSLLNNSNDVCDRKQAIVYAQQLIQQYPKDAKYYGLLAGIAYHTWFRSKSQTDADKAIAAYQHYLDVAAPNEVFRDNAQFYIKYIQQMQDHFNRGDKLPQ